MIAQTKWKKVISWICMLMILFCLPAFSDAQEITNAEKRNQMIRVYLSRLGLTDRLDVTVTVPYQLELENRGEIFIPAKSELGFLLREGTIVLHYQGMSQTIGSKITLKRADAFNGTYEGFYMTHFPALYMGDLELEIVEGKLRPLLTIHVEDYLLGVVPYEMQNGFPLEALKAQAVAARTYAIRNQNQYDDYDVVDHTGDQVFRGYVEGNERAEKAVRETQGVCGFYKGQLAQCYYSASNGGQTELVQTVWPTKDDYGYYAFGEDPYDVENPASTVKQLVLHKKYAADEVAPYVIRKLIADRTKETLEEKGFDAAPESIRVDGVSSVIADSPNMLNSKRMTMLHLELQISVRKRQQANIRLIDNDTEEVSLFAGEEPEQTPTEDVFSAFEPVVTFEPTNTPEPVYSDYIQWPEPLLIDLPIFPDAESAFGLSINSNYQNEIWSVVETENKFTIEVRRYGHGVGMSQRGAQMMADKYGKNYQDILAFYYPGMKLMRYPEQARANVIVQEMLLETPGLAPSPTPRPTLMPVTIKAEDNQWFAKVTEISDGSSLNLRAEPALSSDILMRLYKGQRLLVLERCPQEGWVHVRTDTADGYVLESYLTREKR